MHYFINLPAIKRRLVNAPLCIVIFFRTKYSDTDWALSETFFFLHHSGTAWGSVQIGVHFSLSWREAYNSELFIYKLMTRHQPQRPRTNRKNIDWTAHIFRRAQGELRFYIHCTVIGWMCGMGHHSPFTPPAVRLELWNSWKSSSISIFRQSFLGRVDRESGLLKNRIVVHILKNPLKLIYTYEILIAANVWNI